MCLAGWCILEMVYMTLEMILRWQRQQHGFSTVGTTWPRCVAGLGKEHHRFAWLCSDLGLLFAATFQIHESSSQVHPKRWWDTSWHHKTAPYQPDSKIIGLSFTFIGAFLAIKSKTPHQVGSSWYTNSISDFHRQHALCSGQRAKQGLTLVYPSSLCLSCVPFTRKGLSL